MAALTNRYPIWKYLFIVIIIIAAFIYAAPNLYGEYPAVQIMGANTATVNEGTLTTIASILDKADLKYHDTLFQHNTLLFRFNSTDTQLKAKEIIQATLGENYLVA